MEKLSPKQAGLLYLIFAIIIFIIWGLAFIGGGVVFGLLLIFIFAIILFLIVIIKHLFHRYKPMEGIKRMKPTIFDYIAIVFILLGVLSIFIGLFVGGILIPIGLFLEFFVICLKNKIREVVLSIQVIYYFQGLSLFL